MDIVYEGVPGVGRRVLDRVSKRHTAKTCRECGRYAVKVGPGAGNMLTDAEVTCRFNGRKIGINEYQNRKAGQDTTDPERLVNVDVLDSTPSWCVRCIAAGLLNKKK